MRSCIRSCLFLYHNYHFISVIQLLRPTYDFFVRNFHLTRRLCMTEFLTNHFHPTWGSHEPKLYLIGFLIYSTFETVNKNLIIFIYVFTFLSNFWCAAKKITCTVQCFLITISWFKIFFFVKHFLQSSWRLYKITN